MNDDRASSKHGPRLDEQLAHEVAGQIQGSPSGSRAEEWHEPEPPAEGEPEVAYIPHGHHGYPSGDDRDPDRREDRSRIAGYLSREHFPSDKAGLLETARENNAPQDVMDRLQQLPPDGQYPNHRELWKALDLLSAPRF